MSQVFNQDQIIDNLSINKSELCSFDYFRFLYNTFICEKKDDITVDHIKKLDICHIEYVFLLDQFVFDLNKSLKIEMGIYEYSIVYQIDNSLPKSHLVSIYKDTFNNILNNINGNPHIDNQTLLKSITDNTIDIQKIAFLLPHELHPVRWENLVRKKQISEFNKNNPETSNAFTCHKCGNSKCAVTQMQTRSADEPMTTFVVCVVCHNSFKK